MVRRFGSIEAFDRVKRSQNLVGRGQAVGLDASMGYTQDALTARKQSSTINSHRLILWTTEKFGVDQSELLYEEVSESELMMFQWRGAKATFNFYSLTLFSYSAQLNKRHFLNSGVLNDKSLLIDSATTILGEEVAGEVANFINSNEKYTDVKRILSELEMIGIHGIPTLVAAGDLDFVTSGAARTSELEVFLEDVVAEVGSKNVSRLFGVGKLVELSA